MYSIVKNATHFNPADLVCGVKNYKGKKFDLTNFEMNRTDESLFKDHYMMLDLKQLTHSIDSLYVQLDEHKSKFVNSFIFSKKIDEIIKTDSLLNILMYLLKIPIYEVFFYLIKNLVKFSEKTVHHIQLKQPSLEI